MIFDSSYFYFIYFLDSYDNVIFACPPDVALKMIEKPTWLQVSMIMTIITKIIVLLNFQKLLLANVSYPETETTFEEGIIHNDPTVLPKEYRADLLSKFANFIYITYEPNGMSFYQCSHKSMH